MGGTFRRVFLGNRDLVASNWRPRLDAVSRCLDAWRSRHLSFAGKALVANALAISKVWYLASLIPVPDWVISELNSFLLGFFCSGKCDLVSRSVVIQPKAAVGFSVVSVKFKNFSLLVQWVRRFSTSPAGWVSLLTFWLFDRFGLTPPQVFSNPSSFCVSLLPLFMHLSWWLKALSMVALLCQTFL